MFDPFEKIDSGIMYLVNKSLKTYNYITGGDKLEMANNLQRIAPGMELFGLYCSDRDFFSCMSAAPFLVGFSFFYERDNTKHYNLEQKAKKDGLLDFKVEIYKNYECVNNGVGWGTASFVSSLATDVSFGKTVAVGHSLRALSCYVMRAEDIPKQKNIFSRMKDSLEEVLSPKLEFIPIGAYGKNLEY